jgi:Na+-driven multidrug efflux pump
MAMQAPDPATVLKTILKLALVSLLVGMALSFLEITPEDIFANFGDTILAIFHKAEQLVEWSAGYIVIGAVIVVPLWLIVTLVNVLSGRKKRD